MLKAKKPCAGKLFILSAPSGGGKTSVAMGVINFLKNLIHIEKVTTFTTRKIRINEIPEQDYHFISFTKFEDLKKKGFFWETTEYNGNYYGSPYSILLGLEEGKSFILVTDIAGAKRFKTTLLPEAITIWLAIPSIKVLQERLEKRNTETNNALHKRLNLAENEIAQENREHFFQYHVLNEDLNETIQEVAKIIKSEIGYVSDFHKSK